MAEPSAARGAGGEAAAEEESLPQDTQHSFCDEAKAFHWDKVKQLLDEKPALINVQPAGRWTALHQAAYDGSGTMVTYLLEHRADIGATTNRGKTALQVAESSEVRKLLKAAEADSPEDTPAAAASAASAGSPAKPPAKKKRKVSTAASPKYELNLNFFLVKEAETCSLKDLPSKPVTFLQGLGADGQAALAHRGVKTIWQLASWKFYKICRAIVACEKASEPAARSPESKMNINKALDKKWETKSLDDIMAAPVSALQGLTPADDTNFGKVHVKTIEDLGSWKYARWAEAICDLSEFETSDGSS